MNLLERDYPSLLLARHEGPCLSLYQPTHRNHPDNQQDPIRFRNLLRSLAARLHRDDVQALLAPLQALGEDHAFWNHTLEGLAVLRSRSMFRVYRLQRSVQELAIVADSFHTKPLLRFLQSADRYQILALSREHARMFEGNRDALAEIELASGVPASIDEVTMDAGDRERANRVYGPATPGGTTRHGTDGMENVAHNETTRFFRAVDRAVITHHSQPSRLPLLLAALPEHHHLFRAISRNPFLQDVAVDVYPDDLSIDALRERAWQLLLPTYLAQLARLTDAYHANAARGTGSDHVAAVATAARNGRVATVLIEADRQVPGRIDAQTGAVTRAEATESTGDDLLDDIGEYVLRTGGDAVVVPAERMPTQTGLAAIYRY
ncbi:MAG TPA: hypothetical protein VJV77_11970 [Casimicrobiaceae bacterium]|nr:hypothetical protein [Casimicrobiaceae bacterium]